MKKLLYILAIIVSAILSSCSNSNCEITYSSEGSCIALGNIEGWGAEIKSHEFENGLGKITFKGKVTSVPESAFRGCEKLKSITLPNSITSINIGAFGLCKNLKTIKLPDNLKTIGDSAFASCTSLNIITIPDSVTSIGMCAFLRCSSLQAFYGKYASTDHRSLIVDGVLNSFAPSGLTSYTIPTSVTSIGEKAFYKCNYLEKITIPDGVTSIGKEAFYSCDNLASVYCKATIPPSGGADMFDYNAWNRKIYVPRESVEAYKSADGWKDYAGNIVGYDF